MRGCGRSERKWASSLIGEQTTVSEQTAIANEFLMRNYFHFLLIYRKNRCNKPNLPKDAERSSFQRSLRESSEKGESKKRKDSFRRRNIKRIEPKNCSRRNFSLEIRGRSLQQSEIHWVHWRSYLKQNLKTILAFAVDPLSIWMKWFLIFEKSVCKRNFGGTKSVCSTLLVSSKWLHQNCLMQWQSVCLRNSLNYRMNCIPWIRSI